MSATALKIKTSRATKQTRKVAKREQGYEAAAQRLRATCVRSPGQVRFPVPTVLADVLDSKGSILLVSGECQVWLSPDVRKGVVTALRGKANVRAWLDTSGRGVLRIRWTTDVRGRPCDGGYNLACDPQGSWRPIVLDGATDPATGSVVTSIVRTTVGAFRRAFDVALAPRKSADRDPQRAMRLLPASSGKGFLLASTDGSRAHLAALPASGAVKTSPILPSALVDRIAGLLTGIPDVAPLSIVRSTGDDSKTVVEVRVLGHRIAEYVTDDDARFPHVEQPLKQARELVNTATVRLTYADLSGALGKRPKQDTVCVSHRTDGIRLTMSDPDTGDSTVDVACDASVDAFPTTGFFPRYLLDAVQACGGGEACEVRFAADPCDPCLVRGKRGMAVVMPKRI